MSRLLEGVEELRKVEATDRIGSVSAAQPDAVGLPLCDGPGRVETPADPKLGSRMIQLRGKLRLSSSRLFGSSSQKACLFSYLNGGEFSNWRSVAVQDSLGHLADVACTDAWPLTRVFKVDAACDQGWVGKLLSSCFYAEPCKSEHAGMFAVRLRCRIAPSPHLLNRMLRLRQWETPMHFRVGQGKWSTARLCEERTWALLKDGQEYERRLEVDVSPFGTLLHLKIDTTPADGRLNDISNSSLTVADLLQAHDFFHAAAGLETDDGLGTDAGTVDEEITEPQRGLRGEIDKLGVLLKTSEHYPKAWSNPHDIIKLALGAVQSENGISPDKASSATVLAIQTYDSKAQLVFDMFHNAYDSRTAHLPGQGDLPVWTVTVDRRMEKDIIKIFLATGKKITPTTRL
ncbi:hypothetical protein CSOJ01_11488 [Colletotrichum sojae]|uniref:Uncharacterized protein n=1 Tax=Colletotrichum sojae TaxID=2175907 RepID=A0A8H6IXR0_9PEZI|nr:hypothetical protein CSOJ01_11488 [Colletotrichum sojae]